ncbi:MAG: SDR family NAD(P)-dependent oxidoreductase, partial [Clostridia bacterium]
TDDVIRMFGRIDILINNAGMVQVGETQISVHVADMSYEHWDHGIDRNLNITFNVTRQVIPHMISQGYGRIVNVSSVTGPVVSNPGSSVYGAAKSAITGMSKALAIETAGYGITVNNVLPGWIATDSQTESEKIGAENTPAGRGGTPEEIANLNVFLASDKASYITGQDFIVDGGNTIQEYKGPKKHYY